MKAEIPFCPAVPLSRGRDSGTRVPKWDSARDKQRDKTQKAWPHGDSKTNRRDRQRDARRDILSHFAVLQNGPAGQAVYFADGSPLGPFRCPSRQEKVGSKPCFRFAQTSCPAGLKTGSRGSQ
jgi:hypothetical protein